MKITNRPQNAAFRSSAWLSSQAIRLAATRAPNITITSSAPVYSPVAKAGRGAGSSVLAPIILSIGEFSVMAFLADLPPERCQEWARWRDFRCRLGPRQLQCTHKCDRER